MKWNIKSGADNTKFLSSTYLLLCVLFVTCKKFSPKSLISPEKHLQIVFHSTEASLAVVELSGWNIYSILHFTGNFFSILLFPFFHQLLFILRKHTYMPASLIPSTLFWSLNSLFTKIYVYSQHIPTLSVSKPERRKHVFFPPPPSPPKKQIHVQQLRRL